VTTDELEISIAGYLDGTLADDERKALEAHLAQDPVAQALLEQERALTDLLRSQPLPKVQWDRLAESISSAIDDQLEQRVEQASWRLRMWSPAGLAMAASVLLAIGVSSYVMLHSTATTNQAQVSSVAHTQTAMLIVEGPQSDEPDGAVVSQITVAAGGSYAKDSSLNPYADDIDTRPSRVVIASGESLDASRLGFPN
jgi:hypothetical protein